MKRGKKTCETLKQIRRQVADANGISYAPMPYTHKDDCRGTCPACEAEVRYIERELNARRMLGKAVVVAGVAAGLAALTACNSNRKESKSIDKWQQVVNVEGKALQPELTI